MVAHLFWQDVKYNLRPIRALPVLALAIFLAYRDVSHPHKIATYQDFYFFAEGGFTREHHWLFGVIPLFASIMGSALAAERRSGVTLSILAKGTRRSHYVFAKMLGAAASSALVTSAAICVFFAIVFTTWIPGRAPYIEPVWIEGPVKSLFTYSPFLHDLLSALMLVTAAAALSLIGVLAGLIVANEYVAMAATPISLIIVTVIMRQVSRLLNPEEYLDLGYYFYWGPDHRWLIPFAPFLYWGVFSLVIATVCQRIFANKEIA